MTDRKKTDQVEATLANVARSLALRRVERGLTLRDVAEMSGLSIAGVGRIENGERVPNLRTLILLAKAYKLEVLINSDGVTVG